MNLWQALIGMLSPNSSRRRTRRSRSAAATSLENRILLTAISSMNPAVQIVNGTGTSLYESVGMVGDTGGYGCSGTLIAPQYVLTAGHCAEGVGDTAGRFFVGGQEYRTTKVFLHPSYNPGQLGQDGAHDIALYKLDRPVTNVIPTPINRTVPVVGQLLTLVGFGGGGTGTTGHTGDYGTKRVGTTPIDRVTTQTIFWNFDNNTESNTAPGDSGGPAFVTINGVRYVAGVTSGGDQANAGIGDTSFDTRVDAYAAWIDSIVGSAATTTVGIVASDAAAAETTTNQTANPGAFIVTRTGSIASSLTVKLGISGTAVNGTDYNSLPTTVTIPAGAASATIFLTVRDDTAVEGMETATLTLASGTGYSIDATRTSGTVSITDNEAIPPTVSIAASDAAAAEATTSQAANPGTYVVTRTGSTTAPLVVNLTRSGTAVSGTDYNALPTTVTIPAGAASTAITLTIRDDTFVEGNETAVLTIATGTGYLVNTSQAFATVTIADNEVATSNDQFANRRTITGTSVVVTGSNVGATRESGEPSVAGVGGGKTVWWTWKATITGTVTLSTAGSSFDTTLGVYRGTAVNALTQVVANDDESYRNGIYTSKVTFGAVAGQTYQIAVDGYEGESGNIKLALTQTASRSRDALTTSRRRRWSFDD